MVACQTVTHLSGRSPMQEIGSAKTQKPLQRWAMVAAGYVLVLVGIIALVIPFVPGSVLIIVGGLIVSARSSWPRRALERWRVRSPFVESTLVRVSAWYESLRTRVTKRRCDSGSQFGA
jgi:hypothetical protein